MSVDKAEIERLLGLPEEELFGAFGRQLVDLAIDCLNESLAAHGSDSLVVVDGKVHALSEFIDGSKVQDVLLAARKAAEERHLSVGEAGDVSSIVTDDQAVDYILGFTRDTAA